MSSASIFQRQKVSTNFSFNFPKTDAESTEDTIGYDTFHETKTQRYRQESKQTQRQQK